MKKIISVLLALMMLVGLVTGCGTKDTSSDKSGSNKVLSIDEVKKTTPAKIKAVKKENFKIGFILLHDENSTYDKNFMDAAKAVQTKLGLTDAQVMFKINIPESNDCYEAAAELVDAGCNVVFADSFGHEPYMIQAAKEFKDVQFCHATGTRALTELVPNYHNAFASIYEGRYLAGVAAGMKIKSMIDGGKITADKAKMGYIGAFPYAEVISGLSSFYLGAKSVVESVTMDVVYTNSWFDIAAEKEAAETLIAGGAVLVSQHADSEGAPKACEEKNVPNVAYNINTSGIAPKTALISSKIDWAPYFELICKSVMEGKSIPSDWTGTVETGSVVLTELNAAVAAPGTKEAIEAAKAKLASGELNVFDTSKFTVGGEKLTTFMADVVSDKKYIVDTQVLIDGELCESTKRSAPYLFLAIDGINGVIPK